MARKHYNKNEASLKQNHPAVDRTKALNLIETFHIPAVFEQKAEESRDTMV